MLIVVEGTISMIEY